ncbi:hypothetical protein HPG69_013917, partial [Diceros bicornis minor]
SPPSASPGPKGGDVMTPTLTTLLCLGLSVGSRTPMQAGESVSGPTFSRGRRGHHWAAGDGEQQFLAEEWKTSGRVLGL